MALKRVSFATAHDASTFTSARWNFQPVPDGFGNAPIQLVEIAPGNPRFAYDPATGEPKGLLIEEQRTNIILHSADLTQNAWSFSNVTTMETSIIETEDVNAVAHAIQQQISKSSVSQTYTYTVTTNGGTRNLRIEISDGTTVNRCIWGVNPNNGETVAAANGQGSFSLVGVKVKPLMNGQFEFQLTATTGSEPAVRARVILLDGLQATYIGNGEGFVNILRQQLEEGTTATSPIITSGTAVTRTADIVARTLGAEFNPNEGTFIFEVNPVNWPRAGVFCIYTGSMGAAFDSFLGLGYAPSIGFRLFYQGISTSGVLSSTPSGATKIAVAFNPSGATFYVNGQFGATVNKGSGTATATNLFLGNMGGGMFGELNGTIEYVAYEPRAVSDAELQELSKL